MNLKSFRKNKNLIIPIIVSVVITFFLSSILFYSSFALYEEKKDFNVINGTVEDPGDIYFAYYVNDKITTELPVKNQGYYLGEKSNCTNGVTLSWDVENWIANLDFNSYKKENNSRVKCTLYFSKKIYDDTTLYDLSENHYDGTFQNGATVIVDSQGKKAVSFDGIDDFVDIKDIPDVYDWNNGYTIEFEATWHSFNFWSRILDFSSSDSNENVIFIANEEETNDFYFGGRNGKDDKQHMTDTMFENKLSTSVKQKIKLKKSKVDSTNNLCNVSFFKEERLDETHENIPCSANSVYTNNYLGKSAWKVDGYFHGLIYSLKITDEQGNIILWYDLNY